MQGLDIWKFSLGVWLRFQALMIGLGFILSCISLTASPFYGLMALETINAVLSAIGCTSYALIVYFWVKYSAHNSHFNLKFILHQAGWLNVIFLFILGFFCWILSKEPLDINVLISMAGFAIFIIIVGQTAIYWTTYKWDFNELSTERLENLLEELGTSPKET